MRAVVRMVDLWVLLVAIRGRIKLFSACTTRIGILLDFLRNSNVILFWN